MVELELIVQRMIDAGESEEKIAMVVQEYQSKEEEGVEKVVKTEAVVEDEIAPAMAETVDTELQSVPGLLGSPRLNVGADLEDGLTPEERLQKKREEYTSEDLASIKFQFDKGPEYGKSFGEEAYNKYIETGKIDTNLLPKQNRLVDPETGERLNELEVLDNVRKNIIPQSKVQWASTKNLFFEFVEAAAKQGALNQGLGSGANVLLSDDTKDFQKKLAVESNSLLDEEVKANYSAILNNYKEMAKNPTGAGILGSGSTGLAGKASTVDLVGGLGTAITSVATSVIPTMAASAVAGPVAGVAVMANLMIPSMVTDYNLEKANSLYKDLDTEEERINKLIDEDKQEIGIPVSLGTIATGLEYFGYKGIASSMAKNMSKKGMKDWAKSMYAISKTKKGVSNSTATIKETGTEVAQLIPELTNQYAAQGLSFVEGTKKMFIDDGNGGIGEFWQQAPEVAIQAAFGTRMFQGASSNFMKGVSAVRNRFPGVEGVNANSFFTLGVLKQRKETETNEDVVEGLDAVIAIEEQKIKKAVANGNNIVKKLDDKEVESVGKASTKITEAQEKIEDLKEQKELGLIDNAQYETAIAGFNSSIQENNNFIDGVIEKTVKKENIREDDLSYKTNYDAFLEATRAQSEAKTSNRIALDEYIRKNKELQIKFDAGLITESELNNEKSNNTQKYKNIKQQNDSAIEKVNKKLESVSSSSVKLSVELQNAFDAGIKDGTITKDSDGKNVISNKVYQALEKTQAGFIKQISNSVYNAIPKGLLVSDVTKSDYEQNVKTEFLDLLRSYDGSTPLGAYLQTYLPKRAVRKRALQGISNQRFANDLESSAVQGMIAEEDSDIDVIESNINTAEALGISESLMDEIRNVARRGLLTSQESVDAIKFKSGIAKTFKDALYTNIKKALGLKNTKTNQGLTNAIEANPNAFYDAIAVESMRKARGKNGVNPFVEAGFLEDVNGVLQKVPLKELTVDKFLTYVTDPSIAKNTRSDRQMHLVEALAVSMGAREAINLLEGDIEFRQRFAEQQLQEQQTEDFKVAADKISNVPKAFRGFINVLKDLAQATNINNVAKLLGLGNITVSDTNRVEKQQAVLNAIKKFGLTPNVFEAAMPASSGAVRTQLNKNNPESKRLAAFLVRNNITAEDTDYYYELNNGNWVEGVRKTKADGTSSSEIGPPAGVTNLVASRGRLYYGKTDPAYIVALAEAEKNLKGKKELKPQRVLNDFFSENAQARSDVNMDVLEDVAIQLNDAVKAGMPKEVAALIIAQGYQATGGLIKIAAKFKYKSKVFEYGINKFRKKNEKDRPYREEHNPPASLIGANLIWAISNDKVRDLMPYIRKNYYQTQLSKRDDEKLDIAKLGGTLPQGSTILDNSIVRLAEAGIDLNSIVNPLTGQTLAEENNVESASTPDAVAASNASAVENNTDQVENLIDRAIAKLTELTGTDGTLQTNLGAIPINILIGGLRATKLAYQGGKALSDAIADGYKKVKDYMSAQEWSEFVSQSSQEVKNENSPEQVRLMMMNEAGVAKLQEQVRQGNYNILKEFGVDIDGLTTDEIIEKINILRKAKVVGSNTNAPKKKARVFDFDDTLAKTNSNVLYTLPDGTTGSLDATQFAEQFSELQEAGATFDYSEFSQVKDGSKGPLATLAKRFTESKGDRDVFVLTARPADSAVAIQEFLRSTLGISIPLQNITGLANGKPGAKAMWVAEKVSEGYNDIFFADDVAANVKAVADMLDNLGVTKRVQQAKESGQKSLEDEMDSLIRGKKRSKIGKFLSKINIYIPPGADDFAGLLKYFQAKGKLGDEQMKWFQDNLLTPFAQGISAYTSAKVALADDFTALNKRFKNGRTLGIPSKFRKMLSQEVLGGIYTNEQAVRAYLYNKAGEDLGLNKADTQDLIALVEGNGELKAYADAVSKITKLDAGYPPITEQWLGGSIATDMAVVSNKAQRAEFLQEFTNNKEQIFSDQNMKLIKQIYGNDYADALSNILERMETGQNRKKGKDKEFNSAMNWINQSVGAVMAINMRSAILQQMSIVNYMNWNFNNPIKMGIAMANVPQFMKDYMMILNSDFLKERRGGMAIEVNLADIADSNPGNLFLRLNKKVLELGFKPTQWGDSNAIAFGGATWYRNRYNQLVEQGVSESEANSQAMLEFQEVSETAQQSSRVDKVSRQQASDIGRLILAFANTPLQYARETRKATSDLVNGRGDWKTNASKILYYGVAQNIIFTALQQGLFSLLLSDDDDEEYEKTDKKLMYSLNGVADGMLRGMGYAGAVVAALKNLGMEYYDQRQKRESGERVYDGSLKLIQKGFSISPPISKKIGDIVEGQKFETWKQYKNDPFYQGFAYANYFSGLTNLPADRVFKKIENLKAASQDSTEAWQSVFLALGWSPYNVGVDIEYNIPKNTKRKKPNKPNKPNKPKSPFQDKLPEGVLGRANKDGTMDIKPGLSAKKRKEVIAHEQVHLDQFKSGKLDYTDSDITWKGQKIPRTADSKIFFNGKLYIEGAKNLPWEKEANKLSKNKV
jgi:hypothetical protein